MSELTFFDYNIVFKQHKEMYEHNIFSMISNKILSKTVYKQLKENGENVFIHHFFHYQKTNSDTNLIVSFTDVDTNLIKDLHSIATSIEEKIAKDDVLKDYLTIEEIKFTQYIVPADFADTKGNDPSQKYCLVKDSNDSYYFFVNNTMKAIGDEAIKMAYGISKRENICPDKHSFDGNIKNLIKESFIKRNRELKLSDLTKKLV